MNRSSVAFLLACASLAIGCGKRPESNPAGASPSASSAAAAATSAAPKGIDATEVTVAAFRACVEAGACKPPSDSNCSYGAAGEDQKAVKCVYHEQAKAYCAWKKQRLPTAAEWESAFPKSGELFVDPLSFTSAGHHYYSGFRCAS